MGGKFSVFLSFPTLIALTSQTKESMYQFCQLENMSILIIHLVAGEMTTGWIHELNGPTGELNLNQNAVSWSLYILILTGAS